MSKILKLKKISYSLVFVPKILIIVIIMSLFLSLSAPSCSHRTTEKIKHLDALAIPQDWDKTIPDNS